MSCTIVGDCIDNRYALLSMVTDSEEKLGVAVRMCYVIKRHTWALPRQVFPRCQVTHSIVYIMAQRRNILKSVAQLSIGRLLD